jgi:hypothetical protein
MPTKGEHPNKGWAATYGRFSFVQTRWTQPGSTDVVVG